MRVNSLLSAGLLILFPALAWAGKPLTVSAVLRGKKYSVSNVSTVGELQKSVEEQAGLDTAKQGVLFGGRKLKPKDILEDVGVEDGSVINIVPSSGKKSKSSSSGSSVVNVDSSSSGGGDVSSGGEENMMQDMLKKAGIDTSQIDELMKAMPGGGDGEMPSMQESMGMMQDMMNSPLFKEYMNDPERLEQSRQMILQNPMMKNMMAGMPGFDEILNDPVKWRETMTAAADMYKSMGSDMMNSMPGMGGAGAFGLGGSDNGAFGGFGGSSTNALDELSEGED
mmetsp:Transcript_17045/g.16470  ORF Transcript_17045/g.16470 Transcript_17045/m.16470 type:complete len:281 (-) Transcript_17045:59-901(-)|eukprot:CAMPEP_0197831314 /NCGR_PEP_ID=MMETSP1437-20131217/9211_1 /TAXON_ID=49252 ORGANISM="Eucampia antarctica, Strain CCMP1452" /NCGR_SAMPLE_ID=MMETSP1437 /ASSEMBLY_ACC=CAM_ASM_001096 /LENGTH=280 /DNA_ID=CAMNT_0043434173 /DNA_START=76 /DNA_END=918 /DNA_ORIENTATION=-